jgi:hypothetical protein
MNENPQDTPLQLSDETAAELMRSLLHKQGNWVDWGKACQKLQKAGFSQQTIFEQTGFQGNQQNLIVVAAQVYDSLVQAKASAEILSYYIGPRSDILYEFRILNQEQRVAAAELAKAKKLEVDGAREVAKAIKEVSGLSQLPAEFTARPGDAVAYQCWRRARQKKDLQERSRLIAQGLKFAQSQTAREAIEKLLSDFSLVPSQTAPLIPIYRLETEEALLHTIPFIGSLPLTKAELETVSTIETAAPFGVISFSGEGKLVSLPGWQVVLKAQDPVAIFCQSDQLPKPLPGRSERVLVVIDRQIKEWDVNSYFLIEQAGQLAFRWFEEAPTISLCGQVLLVLRPPKILDEYNLIEPWQMDD